MSKEDMIELEGVVVEAMPNAYIGKAPYEFHTHSPGRQGDC